MQVVGDEAVAERPAEGWLPVAPPPVVSLEGDQRADQRRADRRRADPQRGDQGQADPLWADRRRADPRQAEPRRADPRQADPRQEDRRQADRRQADPLEETPAEASVRCWMVAVNLRATPSCVLRRRGPVVRFKRSTRAERRA